MSSPQGSTWVSASVKNKNDLTATVSVSGAFHLGYAWEYSATTNIYVDGVYVASGTSGSGHEGGYVDIGKASGSRDLPRKASAYDVEVYAYSYGPSGQYYGGIKGDSSAKTTVTIDAYPIYKPDAPTNGSATRDNDNKVSLSWENNTNTTKPYNNLVVQRSVNGGNWSNLATLGGSATTYTDTTTAAGSYYSYRVHSTNGKGASADLTLGTVYMTPSAPTNLRWERVADTTVKLIMTNTTTTATALEVQKRATSADAWETVSTVSGKVTETNVNIGGGEFYVRVRNTRGDMYSPWTQTADKVVTITPPNPPTLIAPASSMVVSKSDGSIRFEWTHNPIDGTPQQKAEIHWRKQGETAWNLITVNGSANYATLSLADIAPGTIVEWYVQTKGAHENLSAQSATWTLDVEQVPTITVTAPTGTVATTPIEYGFAYTDTASKSLASHTVEITDKNGAVVYRKNGGTEHGGTIPREDFLPTNGETYTVTVRATSTSTLSNSANNTFHVEYDLPVGASIETQPDAESGAVTVIVDPLQQQYGYKNIETNTDSKIAISEKQETRNLFGDIRNFTVDRTTYGHTTLIEVGNEPDWGEYVLLIGNEMRVGAIPEGFLAGYGYPEPMMLEEELREYAMPAEGGKNYVLRFNTSPYSSSDVGVANFMVVFYDEEYKTIPVQNGTWRGGGVDGPEIPFYDHANVLGELQYRYETGDNLNLVTTKPSPQGARYATLLVEFMSDVNVYMSHFQFEQGVTSTEYIEHIIEVDTEIQPKDNVSGLTVYGKSVQGDNPSPDNPQEVYSVEGRNLFDPSNVIDGAFVNGITGVITELADAKCYFMECKPNTTYAFSRNASDSNTRGVIVSFATMPTVGKTGSTLVNDYVANGVSFTTPSDAKYLVLFLNRYRTDTLGWAQVEYGNVARPYAPYGSLTVTSRGKNMLDYDTVWRFGYYTADGTYTANENYHSYPPVAVEPGQQYVLSCKPQDPDTIRVSSFDKDMNHLYRLGNTNPDGWFSFTPNSNVAYVVMFANASDSVRPLEAQLEKGTQPTEYEPYTATSTTIDLQGHSLASTELARSELNVDASGHVRLTERVGSTKLSEIPSAKWYYGTQGGGKNRLYTTYLKDIAKFPTWSGTIPDAMMDICVPVSSQTLYSATTQQNIFTMDDNGNFIVMTSNMGDMTKDQAIAAVSEATVYYELAEPRVIDLGNIGKIGLVRPETYMNVNTSIDTNAIVTISRGGIDAVGYDIQRISDNGTVTILANADGHTAYQDRYAPANVDYTYRVVTYADSGAFEVSDEGARLDTPYWYLLTDTETAKAKYNPQASESIACADSNLVRYAGRRYPVLYEADAIDDAYEASGVVIGKDSIEPFRTIQLDGGKAAYKSHDGDVVNVHCSTSVNRRMTTPPTYEVGVSMSRIDGGAL